MKRESGFSMLEILVSMIIIMIGVLGIAGMQLLSINNTEIARYQSLASLLASSMTGQMQSNVAYWGGVSTTITIAGAVITGGPAAGGSCLNTVCTAPKLAYYDLQNWGSAVASTLPSGTGTITCAPIPAPTVCTVTLSWSEKNVALSNPTGTETGIFASGKLGAQTYSTMVTLR